MKSRHFLLVAFAAAAPGLAFAQGQSETAGRPITVQMTGTAERPGPGDPDGSGTAEFRINAGQGRLCYTLTVENIDPATASHIHEAPTTTAGPVVIPLDAPTDGSSEACAEVERDLLREILTDPSDFYVNVHNSAFPGGAVRGQLGRRPN